MITSPAPLIALKTPQNVSLEEVNEVLNKIWMNEPSTEDDGTLAGATRARTFSLMVYEPSETQQLLGELGYYKGPIDGIDGPRTKAAIQVAQSHLGLLMNGRSSPELLVTLREQLQQRRSQQDQSPLPQISYTLDAASAGVADDVASQNPCRIITLCPIPESTGGVTAQVSAYCPVQKQSSGNLICCEYITLKGTEAELAEVSGFIQSLLIGELPKFLWWKAVPDLQHELFRKLSSFSNLVIVDSSTFDEATAALVNIHSLHQKGINVADLNWRRLAAWQELTAEAFDPPSRRAALSEVDRFVLDYEAMPLKPFYIWAGWPVA
jgi:glucose-6-phosphate dehydrogenase assembly protein OpcA